MSTREIRPLDTKPEAPRSFIGSLGVRGSRLISQRGVGTAHTDLTDVAVRLDACGYDQYHFTFEGWLEKKGGVRRNWNSRYFILCPPGCLFYFRDEEKAHEFKELRGPPNEIAAKASGLVLGTIPLTTFREHRDPVSAVKTPAHKGRDHCLQLSVEFQNDSRDFIINCQNETDKINWMEAIQAVHDFERISRIEKYTKLCTICKDPFFGGYIHCNEVGNPQNSTVWKYISNQDEDEEPDIVQMIEGKFEGLQFEYDGDEYTGFVLMESESSKEHGKALWDGLVLTWKSVYRTSRGGGNCWSYRSTTRRGLNKFIADEFTNEVGFPNEWNFTKPGKGGGQTLTALDNRLPDMVPNVVKILGSVPPPVSVACAMFMGMLSELRLQDEIYKQEKIIRQQEELERMKYELAGAKSPPPRPKIHRSGKYPTAPRRKRGPTSPHTIGHSGYKSAPGTPRDGRPTLASGLFKSPRSSRSPLAPPPRAKTLPQPSHSPHESPHGSPLGSPHRSPLGSPHRSPLGSPHGSPVGSPHASSVGSPHALSLGSSVGSSAGSLPRSPESHSNTKISPSTQFQRPTSKPSLYRPQTIGVTTSVSKTSKRRSLVRRIDAKDAPPPPPMADFDPPPPPPPESPQDKSQREAYETYLETEIQKRKKIVEKQICLQCDKSFNILTCYNCGFSDCIYPKCFGRRVKLGECPKCDQLDSNRVPGVKWREMKRFEFGVSTEKRKSGVQSNSRKVGGSKSSPRHSAAERHNSSSAGWKSSSKVPLVVRSPSTRKGGKKLKVIKLKKASPTI